MSERITRRDLEVQLLALVRQVDPAGYVLACYGRHAVIVAGSAYDLERPLDPDTVPNGARLYHLSYAYGGWWTVCVSPAARMGDEMTGMPHPGSISHPFGSSGRKAREMHAALYVAWQSHAFKADLARGWDVA